MIGKPAIVVKFSCLGPTSMKSLSATSVRLVTEASLTNRIVSSGCDARNAFLSLSGFSGDQLITLPHEIPVTSMMVCMCVRVLILTPSRPNPEVMGSRSLCSVGLLVGEDRLAALHIHEW